MPAKCFIRKAIAGKHRNETNGVATGGDSSTQRTIPAPTRLAPQIPAVATQTRPGASGAVYDIRGFEGSLRSINKDLAQQNLRMEKENQRLQEECRYLAESRETLHAYYRSERHQRKKLQHELESRVQQTERIAEDAHISLVNGLLETQAKERDETDAVKQKSKMAERKLAQATMLIGQFCELVAVCEMETEKSAQNLRKINFEDDSDVLGLLNPTGNLDLLKRQKSSALTRLMHFYEQLDDGELHRKALM